ncbi:MAG: DUF805 domain-containing protein [Deltaproteobacteria bacterium]|nr:DUF805 domain-containing protein [Deltaproteobacteria bacterium]
MSYIFHTIRNFGKSAGRANRTEFWSFLLFCVVLNFVVYCIVISLESQGFISDQPPQDTSLQIAAFGGLLSIWFVINFCSSLSLIGRRAHDTGHSIWLGYFLFFCIPLGFIVLGLLKSDPYENKYGLPFEPDHLNQ